MSATCSGVSIRAIAEAIDRDYRLARPRLEGPVVLQAATDGNSHSCTDRSMIGVGGNKEAWEDIAEIEDDANG